MNSASAPAGFASEKAGRGPWLWALAALAVGLLAITGQSLWIDEALTAGKAGQPTFGAWWQAMLADKGSDLQMPLYMGYVWGFAKIFGTGEWALRAANLPWFIAGVAAFIQVFPRPQKIAAALVTLGSPFAWYYLDEARPYAMQLGASLLVFAALHRLAQKDGLTAGREKCWLLILFFGLISLGGSSLLGMIWAGGVLAGAPFLLTWKRWTQLLRAHLPAGFILVVLLAALGGYYLWTLKAGARASDVGTTGARNLAFIGYELAGFAGLGPGRLEIRDQGVAVFRPYILPLTIYAALVLTLLCLGTRRALRNSPRNIMTGSALALIIPGTVILGAGLLLHFRVLARHFTPMMPVILVVLSTGLIAGWSRGRRLAGLLAVCFLGMSLASALSFRFAARHQKDDYRDAAALAKAALNHGQVVWWNAGREGALYYGVPLEAPPGKSGQALWLANPAPALLSELPAPDVVIASKPDIYDAQNAVGPQLLRGSYHPSATLPAFVVWDRPQ